jgi:hypothetical protein
MNKENVVCKHNEILFSQKEKWNYVICGKVDHHIKGNKPD